MAGFRALLVGVPRYADPGIVSLPFIRDDVAELADALRRVGYDDVRVHDPERTSRGELRYAVQKFLEGSAERQTQLIYLSGHGMHHRGTDYLVPTEARRDARDFHEYCLPLTFAADIERSQAGDVLVFVDACREGLELGEKRVEPGYVQQWSERRAERAAGRAVVYVYACGAGEMARYKPGPGAFSLFSRALSDVLTTPDCPATLADLRTAVQAGLGTLADTHGIARQRIRLFGEVDFATLQIRDPAYQPPADDAGDAGTVAAPGDTPTEIVDAGTTRGLTQRGIAAPGAVQPVDAARDEPSTVDPRLLPDELDELAARLRGLEATVVAADRLARAALDRFVDPGPLYRLDDPDDVLAGDGALRRWLDDLRAAMAVRSFDVAHGLHAWRALAAQTELAATQMRAANRAPAHRLVALRRRLRDARALADGLAPAQAVLLAAEHADARRAVAVAPVDLAAAVRLVRAYETAVARYAPPGAAGTGAGRARAGGSATPGGPAFDALLALPFLAEHILPSNGLPPVKPKAVVAASARRCVNCAAPIAQGPTEESTPSDGNCARCQHPYSYSTKLEPREEIAKRYRVRGVLAHGGQGWVYAALNMSLAIKHGSEDPDPLSDLPQPPRAWVALKATLNAADARAGRTIQQEREALSDVAHPNIVGIREFVEHGGIEYIVMDYVHGRSLDVLALRFTGATEGRLPPVDAVRYLIKLLEPLAYLHRRQRVYCDLKPENIMAVSGGLTLVDLGAVRKTSDQSRSFLSTVGFRAPELEPGGGALPSPATDLYSAGRTLAVLVLGRFFSTPDGPEQRLLHALPPPETDDPLLDEYGVLRRVLLRATAHDPAERFATADELADELKQVLREIVAGSSRPGAAQVPPPDPSSRFTPPPHPTGEGPGRAPLAPRWAALPVPLPGGETRLDVRVQQAHALLAAGQLDLAGEALAELEGGRPAATIDWRVHWYRGLVELTAGRPGAATRAFDLVYARFPTEVAPRLALAAAAEAAGDLDTAARLYDVVSAVDPGTTSAAFGLARCRRDRSGQIRAYERVPATSRAYEAAQIQIIHLLAGPDRPVPNRVDLDGAAAAFESIRAHLSPDQDAVLRGVVLAAAARLVDVAGTRQAGTVLGVTLTARDLAIARARLLSGLARRATDRAEKIRLVDQANQTRPWTWL